MGLRELAREARVDPSSLSKLERHQQHTLNPENLARVAQTLGTTAESLLAKVGEELDGPPPRRWPTVEEVLARDRNLTEEQRDVILRMYQVCTRTVQRTLGPNR